MIFIVYGLTCKLYTHVAVRNQWPRSDRNWDNRHRDRLSALPPEPLARILSHLPSDRASTLSRPWRHVSYSVPVVDLVDGKILSQSRRGTGRYFLPVCFDQQVTSAVLSKDPGTPIRVFRLQALDAPADMLDQWILIAATSGAEEFDVELRYRGSSRRTICPFGRSARASADFGDDVRGLYTKTPRQLFRCGTLRRLCLTNWTLDLPAGGVAPSLHTLRLKRIMAPGAVIQQLVYPDSGSWSSRASWPRSMPSGLSPV
jgi:hypothetical protein